MVTLWTPVAKPVFAAMYAHLYTVPQVKRHQAVDTRQERPVNKGHLADTAAHRLAVTPTD